MMCTTKFYAALYEYDEPDLCSYIEGDDCRAVYNAVYMHMRWAKRHGIEDFRAVICSGLTGEVICEVGY